jgi:hypothetical protein
VALAPAASASCHRVFWTSYPAVRGGSNHPKSDTTKMLPKMCGPLCPPLGDFTQSSSPYLLTGTRPPAHSPIFGLEARRS